MDDFEWKTMQEATRRYLSPGKFTTILGYEWTGSNPIGGHHNVFFSSTEARRAPLQETVDLDELYKKLRSLHDPKEVLIIPHAHQSGDWNRNDADMERLAEIQSGHGTFEYFGNKYLQNGFEVGFVGASDNHNGHPGYSNGQSPAWRAARIWRGSIEVKGARLVGFKEPWFAQPQSYRFARNAQNPNRLDYQLNTRGRRSWKDRHCHGTDGSIGGHTRTRPDRRDNSRYDGASRRRHPRCSPCCQTR
ncbi:MAG: DUF3604 domain-containing protein [Acidobacteria bacterium]|nr:DUF3604 domain-containing protein [Acidobacteriota bacterium]